jgi:hypothetical protein
MLKRLFQQPRLLSTATKTKYSFRLRLNLMRRSCCLTESVAIAFPIITVAGPAFHPTTYPPGRTEQSHVPAGHSPP